MFTFTYPARVLQSVRDVIDDEIAQVDSGLRQYVMIVVGPGDPPVSFPSTDDIKARDLAVMNGIARVVDVVLDELSALAVRDRWSGADLEHVIDDLIRQRLIWVYRHQSSKTLERPEFIIQGETAIAARPSWRQFRTVVSELSPAANIADQTIAPRHEVSPSPLLSLKDAAAHLGISVDTLKRMMAKGQIKSVLIGKRRKIRQAEVDRLRTEDRFRYPDLDQRRKNKPPKKR
jgi:excisionase family DNA binding protein